MSRVGVIIVAAGSGTRLGADVPKAFVPLAGQPLVAHALRGALVCADEIVVVVPADWITAAQRVVGSLSGGGSAPVTVVPGGAERSDSVAAGLRALGADVEVVLVHDAARALAPSGLFERVVAAVRSGAPAAVPGVPVVDTVKQVDASGWVVATPVRASLRAIQTPQGFRRDLLERAHAPSSAVGSGTATDDASLVERLGERVLVVEGDRLAFKVTTADDLETAARILAE